MNEILALLLGLLARIGIPLAGMAALVFFLRRLDKRWQQEAPAALAVYRLQPGQQPCWEQKNCSAQAMQNCPASQGNAACWQAHRTAAGKLQAACLDCDVFRSAPLPAPAPVTH